MWINWNQNVWSSHRKIQVLTTFQDLLLNCQQIWTPALAAQLSQNSPLWIWKECVIVENQCVRSWIDRHTLAPQPWSDFRVLLHSHRDWSPLEGNSARTATYALCRRWIRPSPWDASNAYTTASVTWKTSESTGFDVQGDTTKEISHSDFRRDYTDTTLKHKNAIKCKQSMFVSLGWPLVHCLLYDMYN